MNRVFLLKIIRIRPPAQSGRGGDFITSMCGKILRRLADCRHVEAETLPYARPVIGARASVRDQRIAPLPVMKTDR